MGNIQEKGKKFKSQLLDNYSKIKNTFIDQTLGQISVFQSKPDLGPVQYVAKRVVMNDNQLQQEEFYKYNGQFVDTQYNIHPNLWQIHSIYIDEEGGEVSTRISNIIILYEYCLTNLEKEAQFRRRSNIMYQEQDLFVILYSIISVGNFLAEQGRHIVNLHPKHIGLNAEGKIKVCPYRLNPDTDSCYQVYLKDKLVVGYLSPEQLESLQLSQVQECYDQSKVDVYCLGMTMLELATLKSSLDCYAFQNYLMNKDLLRERLLEIRALYSNSLFSLINKMLDYNPITRPNFKDLLDILQPFESLIRAGKHLPNLFEPHPQKLITTTFSPSIIQKSLQTQQSQVVYQPQSSQYQMTQQGQFNSSQLQNKLTQRKLSQQSMQMRHSQSQTQLFQSQSIQKCFNAPLQVVNSQPVAKQQFLHFNIPSSSTITNTIQSARSVSPVIVRESIQKIQLNNMNPLLSQRQILQIQNPLSPRNVIQQSQVQPSIITKQDQLPKQVLMKILPKQQIIYQDMNKIASPRLSLYQSYQLQNQRNHILQGQSQQLTQQEFRNYEQLQQASNQISDAQNLDTYKNQQNQALQFQPNNQETQ